MLLPPCGSQWNEPSTRASSAANKSVSSEKHRSICSPIKSSESSLQLIFNLVRKHKKLQDKKAHWKFCGGPPSSQVCGCSANLQAPAQGKAKLSSIPVLTWRPQQVEPKVLQHFLNADFTSLILHKHCMGIGGFDIESLKSLETWSVQCLLFAILTQVQYAVVMDCCHTAAEAGTAGLPYT